MRTIHLLALIMVTFCGNNIWAQQPTNHRQKNKLTPEQRIEMKVKHMQQRLLLDEATAAKFTPLYTEYLNAMKACHSTIDPKQKQASVNLTDDEVDKKMQAQFATRKKMIETQEDYYQKFKKILNIRQVEQLFTAHSHSHKKHKAAKHPTAKRMKKEYSISNENK